MGRSTGRVPRSDCPISLALEAVGDSWSLLVVRDLMFKGRNTFKDFLEAEEQISSNILSDRLERLQAIGIIQKTPDPDDGRRATFVLTEMGMGLAPVLVELVLWSDRHFKAGAPPELVHAMRHSREEFLAQVRARWESTRDGATL